MRVMTVILAVAVTCGVVPSSMASAEGLMNPAALTETAPQKFTVEFDTSRGKFQIEIDRASAPIGVDRFYNLVKSGYFEDVRFFRVVPNFVVQFGMHGDPAVNAAWRAAKIKDDPVKASNVKGTLTFAKAGKDSRTTQLFINLADNSRLDDMGFPAFGKVVKGMRVVTQIYGGYGDAPPGGRGPKQSRIAKEGNEYLKKFFPRLDYIKKVTILDPNDLGEKKDKKKKDKKKKNKK